MRQKLEFQADRIEAVLTLHKVAARVTGGTVTPRWVRFQVLPAVGTKISRIKGLSEELAAALDTSNCRVSRRGAAVTVEVPRNDPQPVRLLPLYRQLIGSSPDGGTDEGTCPSIPPATAILGLAEDGTPLLIRLPSPDVAHILVAGTTGSGKTVLLQTMVLSLALANRPPHLSLMLLDPKRHAFSLFGGLPHLARPVIWDAEESAEALHSLVRLMERRTTGSGLAADGRPSVVVVIDELADLLMTGGKAVQWALTRLTQRGREAGIHVVAATQKPTAAVLGPLVKANFPVRLVGRVTSSGDARTATGWSGTGAERLLGRGDFLAVAEGRVTRFQAAHVSPQEIREVVMGIGDEGWNGGWRVERGEGEVLPARLSPVAPAGRVALPWSVSRLSEVFRGGAQE
jgi:S-DNA-T family DNA segregation ATPase FtsK/SpoIIIE